MPRRSHRFGRSRKSRVSRIAIGLLVLVAAGGAFAASRKWGNRGAAPILMATENTPRVNAEPVRSNPAAPAPTPPLKPFVDEFKIKAPSTAPAVPATAPIVKIPATRPAENAIAKKESPRPEVIIPSTGRPLEDAQKNLDAGLLPAARAILNQAIVNNQFATAAEAESAHELLRKINEQLVFGRRVFAEDPYSLTYTVQTNDRLQKLAASNDVTWELLSRVNGISDPRKLRVLQTIKIIKGPFHAVVTKSKFTMDIFLGAPGGPNSQYVSTFKVGLGKDDTTPAGVWRAEHKLKNPTFYSPRNEGIIAADDPRNPLGEFWIGLAGVEGQAVGKSSYGIHGTIEPDTIGKQASNGCIRMLNTDIAVVYELLVEGKSLVVVKD